MPSTHRTSSFQRQRLSTAARNRKFSDDGILKLAEALKRDQRPHSSFLPSDMSLNIAVFLETFAYQPSGTDPDAIRLVELQPGRLCDDVRLKLMNTMISKAPQFTALSYVWGSELDTRMIAVDGFFKQIGANLWDCLRHLQSYQPIEKLATIPTKYEKEKPGLRRLFSRRIRRHEASEGESSRHRTAARRDCPLLLWIEQLCINQQNLRERNHQVQLMASLYGAAADVVAWIPPTELSERRIGKQLLVTGLDIVRRNTNDIYHSPWPLSVGGDETIHEAREKRFLLDQEQGLANESFLVHNKDQHIRDMDSVINDILCSEYWSRLWIRQEVLANNNTWTMYGNFAISLRNFAAFACMLKIPRARLDRPSARPRALAFEIDGQEEWHSFYRSNLKESTATFDHNQNGVRSILEVVGFQRISEKPQFDMATALGRWGSGKSSDVRDKIYALLSLMKQGHELQVHYDLPAQSVLCQALALHYDGEGSRKDFGSTLLFLLSLLKLLDVDPEEFQSFAIELDASTEAYPALCISIAKTKPSYLVDLSIEEKSTWKDEFDYTHNAYWNSKFRGTNAGVLPSTELPAFDETDIVWYLDIGVGSFCLVLQEIGSVSEDQRIPVHLKAWGTSGCSNKHLYLGNYDLFPPPACLKLY